ncbi:hypothetical protein FRC12_015843 [Ceratobasidium sp. 428]|nr:hypothetical protein FRC12_015843 [Ceratobasidium sp. 428]
MAVFGFTPLALGVLAACARLSSASSVPEPDSLLGLTLVNIRIEGATSTIYEGVVATKGHNVTTASGGTHHCDGTNLSANPTPGPTCTSALDDAAKLTHFAWDGTYSTTYDDYFVTKIGGSAQTDSQFWGVLLNWHFTSVGGCQQKVATKDEILWAYDAFNKAHFLKLDGPTTTKVNVPFQGKYRPPVPLSRLT